MASLSMSRVRYPLMLMLLVGHGGVLTPASAQELAECGKTCGGFVMRMCVKECHCVFYPGDAGLCLPHGLNESHLPPKGTLLRGHCSFPPAIEPGYRFLYSSADSDAFRLVSAVNTHALTAFNE
ncbi:hypothetical protein MRX96_059192 [Rhipicephalus microplus]